MAHYVIYVPGIGDHRTYGQNIAIQLWRLFGLRPIYMPLGWNKDEGFNKKQARLMDRIASLKSKGHSVSVVGVSAGASAVLNVFALSDDISGVVCISGKINNPGTVWKRVLAANPDFKESLNRVSNSLALLTPEKREKIMSIHPWRDMSVPIKDTIVDGAKEKTLPGWSHGSGIFFGVVAGSLPISRFILSK